MAYFRLAFALAAAASLGAAEQDSGDQSELTFVDLRVEGGIHNSTVGSGDVTIMAGNIGDKNPRQVDTWSDAGFVIGLRGLWDYDRIAIGGAPSYKARLVGAELLGGLGFYASDADEFELVVGYGKGEVSDATSAAVHRIGSFTTYSAEIGWYHQLVGPLQVGGKAGASYDQVSIDGPLGGKFTGKRFGVDLMVEIGWRF